MTAALVTGTTVVELPLPLLRITNVVLGAGYEACCDA